MIPEKMKAIVVPGDGTVELRELNVPEIHGYEMLIKMQAVGFCATDYQVIDGTWRFALEYPSILGHECVGEVVALGPKCRHFEVGDRVLFIPCPSDDRPLDGCTLQWGGVAEYGIGYDHFAAKEDGEVPYLEWKSRTVCQKISKDLDPVEETMMYTFRETYSAAKKFGVGLGSSVVVYGAGPVGCSFIRFCKLLGAETVIAVEANEARIKNALAAGADVTLLSGRDDIVAEVRKLYPDGVDFTIDAAGVPALINQNLRLIRHHGKVCVYAESTVYNVNVDWSQAPGGWNLCFSQDPEAGYAGEVHDDVRALVDNGDIKGMDYISDVYSFDNVMEAYEFFLARKNDKKVVVRF